MVRRNRQLSLQENLIMMQENQGMKVLAQAIQESLRRNEEQGLMMDRRVQQLLHYTHEHQLRRLKWFTVIAKYRKAKKANFWYPDDFIYAKLRETHSEADIAVLCQKLMNTSKAKKVAKTLQHHLFQAWNNRGMRLEDVADMLGVLVSTANSVRSGILVDYQLKLTGEAVTRVRHG
ncbi:hypothetical protein PHYSODRAFT_342158 [Phytophthora sojae]|uniref:RXLR phytopathogen effector protein WY-domain domain-containing protein n=1 Tax=Phytophthora sojae (strain P6497) TaxID=1094619 RepID=G5AFI4_PHYSP|nr:hypothetical protein PHYSODRAFT_342158 [Phytophthora sojae]EGZ05974.1 hypothetical protein PHYSODRAFT_342158 [Phytophthora sojae]|eukprot:XP_009538835.1 hypothetical protein PHYSODRAFT_342158 [Phytophthora sojae]